MDFFVIRLQDVKALIDILDKNKQAFSLIEPNLIDVLEV